MSNKGYKPFPSDDQTAALFAKFCSDVKTGTGYTVTIKPNQYSAVYDMVIQDPVSGYYAAVQFTKLSLAMDKMPQSYLYEISKGLISKLDEAKTKWQAAQIQAPLKVQQQYIVTTEPPTIVSTTTSDPVYGLSGDSYITGSQIYKQYYDLSIDKPLGGNYVKTTTKKMKQPKSLAEMYSHPEGQERPQTAWEATHKEAAPKAYVSEKSTLYKYFEEASKKALQ